MTHAIYDGSVMHHRVRPRRHRFTYRVFWTLVDIDELDRLPSLMRWNRFGLLGFYDTDHGPRDGSSLRPWIEATCSDAGIDIGGGRVRLLSFPRMLGYVFNPLSVWFCENADGELRAILYEVANTFGEYHSYLLPVDGAVDHTWDKQLFVSPFVDVDDVVYRFRMQPPTDSVLVASRVADADGHLLSAVLSGEKLDMSNKNLRSMLIKHPLMTLKVIAAIHWQAVRLILKRAPYRSRGLPPAQPVSAPLEAGVKA
ncbi:MAG: DUF1365 domain-containing protein [Acidimicrobiia bacterium]|nr:DUF1365 domain-containing protein [Acidimicrobiia bacterium]NNC43916.1 DUF1365 domain-containing protein [Acidimicrobiia bacterium]NND12716.1 DUF1365 domain-containing protein [Acidimicrobiia bacterium]NNL28607.1 DUF1365 domain-containing protein [Acidimicrobiia bacterium]